MNRATAILAATTALFAASTLYLYRRLEALEGAVAPARAAATLSVEPNVARSASATSGGGSAAPGDRSAAPSAPAVAGAAASSAIAARAGKPDPNREMMAPFAKDFLRQYDDPSLRATLLRTTRAGIEAQYSRLRDKLRLDAATFDQLMALLSQEQLDQQASFYRCLLDARCDTSNSAPPRDHSDEYLALLGGDRLEQFNAYRSALPDWQSVVQLRGRLPESNALDDGNAERLLNALSAQRTRYAAEMNRSGASLRGWGNGTGMIWYSGDGGAQEQLASATQYSERLRQSAAAVLNSDQLRVFEQLQDELLAGLTAYLQSQNRD